MNSARAETLANLLAEGNSRRECQRIMGVARATLFRAIRQHGIDAPTAETRAEKVRTLRLQGKNLRQCAEELGTTVKAVSSIVRRNHWAARSLAERIALAQGTPDHEPRSRTLRPALHSDYAPSVQLPSDPPPDDWMPGGARLPVDRTWPEIRGIALNEGFVLSSVQDLPSYNHSRTRRRLAPYAIKDMKPTKWR